MITMPADKEKISHRFDLGLAFFLLLLLIKLIIACKEVSIPMEHSSVKPIISFMILGLFSMGLVHIRRSSQTGGITYLKGAGVAMSFTAIILLLGGGLFILFLPALQALPGAGADLLGAIKTPIGHFLIFLAMLSFKSGPSGGELTVDFLPAINRQGGALGFLHYLFIGMIIMIFLVVAGFILYRLLTWLFSKTGAQKEKMGIWDWLLSCLLVARRVLSILWARTFYSPEPLSVAEKCYRRLLRWGRFSGLHHSDTETPMEYGIRLGQRFPRIEKEIRHIIHMHDEVIYGCISPGDHQISRVKISLRRIRNPLLWFDRFKSLCFDYR
jgi:hypothetical protein